MQSKAVKCWNNYEHPIQQAKANLTVTLYFLASVQHWTDNLAKSKSLPITNKSAPSDENRLLAIDWTQRFILHLCGPLPDIKADQYSPWYLNDNKASLDTGWIEKPSSSHSFENEGHTILLEYFIWPAWIRNGFLSLNWSTVKAFKNVKDCAPSIMMIRLWSFGLNCVNILKSFVMNLAWIDWSKKTESGSNWCSNRFVIKQLYGWWPRSLEYTSSTSGYDSISKWIDVWKLYR